MRQSLNIWKVSGPGAPQYEDKGLVSLWRQEAARQGADDAEKVRQSVNSFKGLGPEAPQYEDEDWPEVARITAEPFQFGLPECSEQYSRCCAAVWEAPSRDAKAEEPVVPPASEEVKPNAEAPAEDAMVKAKAKAKGKARAEEAKPNAEAPAEEAMVKAKAKARRQSQGETRRGSTAEEAAPNATRGKATTNSSKRAAGANLARPRVTTMCQALRRPSVQMVESARDHRANGWMRSAQRGQAAASPRYVHGAEENSRDRAYLQAKADRCRCRCLKTRMHQTPPSSGTLETGKAGRGHSIFL